MGEGVGYFCKKCKAEKSMMYGIGFLGVKEFYTEKNFKELLEIGKNRNIKNYKKMVEFIKQKNVDMKDSYGNVEYICEECGITDMRFKFTLYTENRRFYPIYECSYCKGKLRQRKSKDPFKLKCDKCGSTEFEEETDFILWD